MAEDIMRVLQANVLDQVVAAHTKMVAAEKLLNSNIAFPKEFKEGSNTDAQDYVFLVENYVDEFNAIKGQLGYLSTLNSQQFSLYLHAHLPAQVLGSGSIANQHMVSQVNAANYHFLFQAFIQVAKVCALALVLLVGLVALAIALPQLVTYTFAGDPLVPMSLFSAAMSGLAGHGLYSAACKFSPTAEEIITYQPNVACI